jgi:molybdate transport system substrate-binding protein
MIGARMGAVGSRVSRRLAVLAVAGACLAGLGGCGGGGDDSNQLVVSAAASLDTAFNDYVDAAGVDAKMSFAGSDELAAQIRQGVKPDVYAAANTSLPDELHNEGLVGEPTVFASNTLVLAVPEDSQIDSLDDLTKPGTSIVMGDPTVPVGSYTREVLDHLPADQRKAIYDNVRSEEPDVSSISGKLTQGAADAGFVYITDVTASSGQLKAIQLPADLQPNVAYGAAVVTGAKNPEGARKFIDGLLSGDGATALEEAGFKPPPG